MSTERITRNIVLIGFASSGKTATGTALASLTGFAQVDLDCEVERIYRQTRDSSLTCREIFRSQGEEVFSALEELALRELVARKGMILSTGGHAPVPAQNRPLIVGLGTVVYLRANLKTIVERMHTKGIPASMANQNMEQLWLGEITAKEYLEGLDKIYQQELKEGVVPPIPKR